MTKGSESQEAGVTGAILEATKHAEDAYNFVSYFLVFINLKVFVLPFFIYVLKNYKSNIFLL